MAPSLDVGIQQFLDHLRVERELTPATVEAYGRDLARFAHFACGRTISRADSINTIDILDFLVHLNERKLSARSQARRLVALRQLFKFFKGERIITADPTEDVDLPRFGRKLPDYLTIAEVDSLLAAPDRRTPRGGRDGAMIETLYATGLRVSELCKLRMHDINFDAGYLMAVGKGRKERLVPVGEVALESIRAYVQTIRATFLGARATDTLFLTHHGRAMTRQGFWKLLGRHAVVAAGIPQQRISPKSCSFTYPHLVEQGADLRPGPGHARSRRHRHHRDLHPRLARPALSRRFHPRLIAHVRPSSTAGLAALVLPRWAVDSCLPAAHRKVAARTVR